MHTSIHIGKCNHPNIVRLFGHYELGAKVGLILGFVEVYTHTHTHTHIHIHIHIHIYNNSGGSGLAGNTSSACNGAQEGWAHGDRVLRANWCLLLKSPLHNDLYFFWVSTWGSCCWRELLWTLQKCRRELVLTLYIHTYMAEEDYFLGKSSHVKHSMHGRYVCLCVGWPICVCVWERREYIRIASRICHIRIASRICHIRMT